MSNFEANIQILDECQPLGTRMEVPEQSYAQELLAIPVPFHNRVVFLSEYEKVKAKPMTLREISVALNIPAARTSHLIEDVGAPVIALDSMASKEIYDEYTLGVLQEELAWLEEYEQLDEFLSAKSIGRHFGKNAEWVQYRTNEFGIFPEERLMPSKRYALAFKKTTILPLRHWMLHHPPGDGMYTVHDLMKELGRHQDWVIPRLEAIGAQSVNLVSRTNNILTPHYSEETLQELKEMIQELPEPAGDWLTVGTMAMVLEHDRKWVLRRINPYLSLAEQRLDDWGRKAVHYPPEVFDALAEENMRLRKI